ncbi:MAG: repeat protein [Acidimicrobiales bacterium]|nr:repeat protein [Acidimicrobiales bacterium]
MTDHTPRSENEPWLTTALRDVAEWAPAEPPSTSILGGLDRTRVAGGFDEQPGSGRSRRWIALAATVLVAGALSVTVSTLDDREPSEVVTVTDPAEVPGEATPDVTTSTMPIPSLGARWEVAEAGMSGSFTPSSGDLIAVDDRSAFLASGFGNGVDHPSGEIIAVDLVDGSPRWSRKIGGPAFLQGVAAGIVIANTQKDLVVGLDAVDGSLRWSIDLRILDLARYGAVTSAVANGTSAIGLSAMDEGDARPPVILGINPSNGSVRWRQVLTAESDLQWGTPPIGEGQTVFLTTPTSPGTTAPNTVSLIELDTGKVAWSANLGAGQGFGSDSPILADAIVVARGPAGAIGLRRTDGAQRWQRPGQSALVVADELWSLAEGGTITQLDPSTGVTLKSSSRAPISGARQLLDIGSGRVAVAGDRGLVVVDKMLSFTARVRWDDDTLVDVLATGDHLVIAATSSSTVTAYDT